MKILQHPEETKIEKVMFTSVFTAALFTISLTWNQPKYPSIKEWINKLWYKYAMQYYSAIKRNTFESVLMRWMKLEPLIQSDVKSERYKQVLYVNTHIWNAEKHY